MKKKKMENIITCPFIPKLYTNFRKNVFSTGQAYWILYHNAGFLRATLVFKIKTLKSNASV